MGKFLPYLSLGLIFWAYISGTLQDCTVAFVSSEHLIKQIPLQLSVYITRVIFRNILILFHNFLIFPCLFIILRMDIDAADLLFIPLSFIIVTIFLYSVGVILAIICTRYRDLSQIISNMLQVFFYLTPIVWMPSLRPSEVIDYVLKFNVFNYVLGALRDPFLGVSPTSYMIMLFLITIPVTLCAFFLLKKYKHRIVYWL